MLCSKQRSLWPAFIQVGLHIANSSYFAIKI